MLDTSGQEAVDVQGVSRRDFLKFCSLMIGGLALPRDLCRVRSNKRSRRRKPLFYPTTLLPMAE